MIHLGGLGVQGLGTTSGDSGLRGIVPGRAVVAHLDWGLGSNVACVCIHVNFPLLLMSYCHYSGGH